MRLHFCGVAVGDVVWVGRAGASLGSPVLALRSLFQSACALATVYHAACTVCFFRPKKLFLLNWFLYLCYCPALIGHIYVYGHNCS